jgi:excisionase family DNA binding protein
LSTAVALTDAGTKEDLNIEVQLLREMRLLQAAVAELLIEVRISRSQPPPARKPIDCSKALLSLAEAARIIGVDRKTTLADLIAAGEIETVPGTRGMRIPRAEVERLVREGVPVRGGRRRRRAPQRGNRLRPKEEVLAGIRAIKID